MRNLHLVGNTIQASEAHMLEQRVINLSKTVCTAFLFKKYLTFCSFNLLTDYYGNGKDGECRRCPFGTRAPAGSKPATTADCSGENSQHEIYYN